MQGNAKLAAAEQLMYDFRRYPADILLYVLEPVRSSRPGHGDQPSSPLLIGNRAVAVADGDVPATLAETKQYDERFAIQ